MDAKNAPVTRQYNRKEVHTNDMPLGQKDDIDISLDASVSHGESFAEIAGDVNNNLDHLAKLAFMEEPMTIRIEENSRSDFPETHVPVAVQGKNAEVLINGQWVALGWLPINQVLTTKRKYVEVLARANPDSISTVHDEATVERPRNTVQRRTRSSYPLSVIEDRNPKGADWLSAIRMGH